MRIAVSLYINMYPQSIYIPQTELVSEGALAEKKRIRWLVRRVSPKVPETFPLEKSMIRASGVQNMQQNIGCRKVPGHFCKVFQCFLLLGCSRTAQPAQPAQAAQPGPASCPRRRVGMHKIHKNQWQISIFIVEMSKIHIFLLKNQHFQYKYVNVNMSISICQYKCVNINMLISICQYQYVKIIIMPTSICQYHMSISLCRYRYVNIMMSITICQCQYVNIDMSI